MVLAPERYDPRRESLKSASTAEKTIPLGSIALSVRQTVGPQKQTTQTTKYIVFDTSDVRDGLIVRSKKPMSPSEIGSAKKKFQPNDVLISRLRPYLRQVALADEGVVTSGMQLQLAASTEFFILRSKTAESIAFLVPFLLSRPVQEVLAASQEGGHHPRFHEEILLTLPVPEQLLHTRLESSEKVIKAAASYRQAERAFIQLIQEAENAIVQLQMATSPNH